MFLNPDIYDRLGATGAQVVMSHEAVHVATEGAQQQPCRSGCSKGSPTTSRCATSTCRSRRRPGRSSSRYAGRARPRALPGPAEFGSTDAHLGAAYESAWLACLVLADRGGEDALVAFYAAMDDGAELGRELRTRFGWTEQAFVEAWQHG